MKTKSNGKDEVVFHILATEEPDDSVLFHLYASDAQSTHIASSRNAKSLSRKAFEEYGATIVRWNFDLKLAE